MVKRPNNRPFSLVLALGFSCALAMPAVGHAEDPSTAESPSQNDGTADDDTADGDTPTGNSPERQTPTEASLPDVPTAGPTPPQGALAKEVIRDVVRTHITEVKRCYERVLVKTPSASGKSVIEFTVGPEGAVVSTRVQTPFHPDVDACIAAEMMTWTFPPPKGGGIVKVSYPFVFKAAE